jgi:hypothetical protein
MLVMTMQITIPVREIDDRITAVMFFCCFGFVELKVSFWFCIQNHKSRVGDL